MARDLSEWTRDPNGTPAEHLSIAQLNVSTRCSNALENSGLMWMAQVANCSAGELVDRAHLDGLMLEEITHALARYELRLSAPKPADHEDDDVIKRLKQTNKELAAEILQLRSDLERMNGKIEWAQKMEAWWGQAKPAQEQKDNQIASLTAEIKRLESELRATRSASRKPASPSAPTTALTPQIITSELLHRFKQNLDHLDYPRMMFHPTLDAVTVRSQEQEEALGPEWSRTFIPRVESPAEISKPVESSTSEVRRLVRAQQAEPRPPAARPLSFVEPQKHVEPAATWQELRRRLGHQD